MSMYWHHRSMSIKKVLGTYGPIVALSISVLINLMLWTTLRGNAHKAPPGVTKPSEQLAKEVTLELLDTTYFNYAPNTSALLRGDQLAPPLARKMQEKGLLPKTTDEMKAMIQSLTEKKQVVAVRVGSISSGVPDSAQGFLPIDVQGQVASHSASGATERPFHFRFSVGLLVTKDSQGNVTGTGAPLIVDFQDISTR